MPTRKSQLQGLKTCNRLGMKKKKRRARCTQSERRLKKPLGGIGSELGVRVERTIELLTPKQQN